MYLSAFDISELLQGKLEGNSEVKVSTPAKIEEAKIGGITFLANPKYEKYLYTTEASVVIINEDIKLNTPIKPTIIRVKNAYESFTKILEKFNVSHNKKEGIEQPTYIASSAQIGKQVYIGAFSYIDEQTKVADNTRIFPQVYLGNNVKVGEGTIIYAGVKIYNNCEIGKNCIIHSGAVVGSDGFGFAPQADGTYHKIPQTGNVVIEDNVEIGANVTIDRATLGSTIIKKGVKLDNLVQIAHNVELGENTVAAAQAGVSGSTKVGKNCVIGGQAGLVGHIHIANYTRVNAQSGISKSIKKEGKDWTGSPAFEYKNALRSQVVFKNLPDLEKKVHQIEEQLSHL